MSHVAPVENRLSECLAPCDEPTRRQEDFFVALQGFCTAGACKKNEISFCFLLILKLKVFDSDIGKQRKPVSYLLIYGRPGGHRFGILDFRIWI